MLRSFLWSWRSWCCYRSWFWNWNIIRGVGKNRWTWDLRVETIVHLIWVFYMLTWHKPDQRNELIYTVTLSHCFVQATMPSQLGPVHELVVVVCLVSLWRGWLERWAAREWSISCQCVWESTWCWRTHTMSYTGNWWVQTWRWKSTLDCGVWEVSPWMRVWTDIVVCVCIQIPTQRLRNLWTKDCSQRCFFPR